VAGVSTRHFYKYLDGFFSSNLILLVENINQVDMRKLLHSASLLFVSVALLQFYSCRDNNKVPSTEAINAINLKKGDLVLCSAT
jgi:hypothetical protein